ncbi:hypothetical protein HPB50_028265 [Hyalomma asiaticum]|nr:hypothetical protein HPB50_028265 [Hyalomma asiaticum]
MPTCYVPGCTSGYRKDARSSDRHFFYAPSDLGLRSAWNRAIPRADKELTTKSRVCDLHFHEQDILKTYVHVIDGKTIEIPRGKWSLAKDAVPKVFPNLPAYLSKPPAKKRKPRREITKQTSTETPGQHNDSPCVYLEQPEGSQILDAQKLTIADMKSVELPPGWRMITLVSDNSSEGEPVAFFTLKHGTECLQIEKSVVVNSESSATASAYGRAATAYASIPIRAVEDLTSLLKARFFGVVRSFGGDEDHPTITHFSQIFRLLSLYTPLKMATKGNCTGEADPVLVAVNDSLSNEKVIALAKKEAREEQLAKVVSQIELREPVAADTLQHSYVRTTAQASALYYLGGYVAKKAHKFTSCEDCLATCVSDGYVPAAAALTEMKSFVPGSLQHPSGALTSVLSSIEHVIQRSTKDNKVFGDLFWSIMEELSECVLTRVGCTEHFEVLSARIIKFYLTTRMHFYSRFIRQQQDSSVPVKSARKRAKLL